MNDFIIENFEPFVLDETIEDVEDGYYYDDNNRIVRLCIGDKNSDVVFNVIVYNISDYGQYSFDIDSVDNTDMQDSVLIKNENIWSKIDELIYDEVVFDETH